MAAFWDEIQNMIQYMLIIQFQFYVSERLIKNGFHKLNVEDNRGVVIVYGITSRKTLQL